jgi:hypothetical protein
MRSFEPLKKIENVVKGNTATVQLPINNTYDRIYLKIAGMTKAQMKNIRLELNGRLVFDYKDAVRMEEIDAYYKRNIETDVVAIHFNEDDLTRTFEEGAFFGLATYGLQTAVLSFDIDAAATAPVVTAFAEKSEPFAALGQWIKKGRNYPFSVAAGVNEITTLPRPDGASIKAIHIRKSDVVGAELVIDNTKWFELDKAINEQMQKRYGRAPDTDFMTIDFMLQGKLSECLPLTNAIQDMRLRVNCTTGGTVEVFVEYYDTWSQTSF